MLSSGSRGNDRINGRVKKGIIQLSSLQNGLLPANSFDPGFFWTFSCNFFFLTFWGWFPSPSIYQHNFLSKSVGFPFVYAKNIYMTNTSYLDWFFTLLMEQIKTTIRRLFP